jgi:hypothetical protein
MARAANRRLPVSLAALWLAAALSLGAVTSIIRANDEFPVRWSASLGLASLADLEDRLSRPLWSAAGILLAGKWRHVGAGEAPEPVNPVRIASCADYRAADLAALTTSSQSDHNLLAEFGATCRALDWLARAKPSRQSFVADFNLDEAAAELLPAGIAIPVNSAERRAIQADEAAGRSWRRWHESRGRPLRAGAPTTDGGAVFEWAAARSRLAILARGDFDGDGIEDVLLLNSEWPGYAHAMRSEVFLLTRRRADAGLRLLPPPDGAL